MHSKIHTYRNFIAIITFFTLGWVATSNAQTNADVLSKDASALFQIVTPEGDPQENLDYMVTTWSSPVTKEEVKKYTSILDFWTEDDKAKYKHDAFTEIWVVNLKDYPDWTLDINEITADRKASSPTEVFTKEQLALVANAKYSDHLRFSARFNSTRIKTGVVEENVLVSQSISLVPDVQASYKDGFEALVKYLKVASKDQVKHVKRDEVGRCRVFFTVSSKGTITDVKMVESSNYPDVDKVMTKIIWDIPRNWTPARDENGTQVDQEFVFTFGMAGC